MGAFGSRAQFFGHSDQIGEVVCFHLLHSPGAMNIYCLFTDTWLKGNLLVEQGRH